MWRIIKIKTFVLIFLFHVLQVGPSSSEVQTAIFKGIPENWAPSITTDTFVRIGNSYYHVEVDKNVNWFAATHECRKLNGNLASIESESERRALEAYLVEKNLYEWFWISGNDLVMEGQYMWMGTGEVMRYNFWLPDQPDNWDGVEDCVNIKRQDRRYFMNDENCTNLARYICELNTPTTISFTIW